MDESATARDGGGTPESAETSGQDAAALAAELARTRERLAFYESFDALIQDNVQRSGELLRRLAAEQAEADQKLRAMQAEVARRLTEQRAVLDELATGLSGLQVGLGAITSRLGEALAALPPAASASGGGQAEPVPDQPPALVSGSAPTLFDAALDRVEDEDAGAMARPVTPPEADSATVPAIPPAVPVASGDLARPSAPDQHDEAAPFGEPALAAPVKPDRLDVIIHGVPNAATALALQRHLQGLTGVDSVDVREYVSGVLRFQVTATTLDVGDLPAWPGGDLELVTAHGHVLELKLASAEGF